MASGRSISGESGRLFSGVVDVGGAFGSEYLQCSIQLSRVRGMHPDQNFTTTDFAMEVGFAIFRQSHRFESAGPAKESSDGTTGSSSIDDCENWSDCQRRSNARNSQRHQSADEAANTGSPDGILLKSDLFRVRAIV